MLSEGNIKQRLFTLYEMSSIALHQQTLQTTKSQKLKKGREVRGKARRTDGQKKRPQVEVALVLGAILGGLEASLK